MIKRTWRLDNEARNEDQDYLVRIRCCAGSSASRCRRTANDTDSGFSFAVYGDSRSMMYLPGKSDQKEEATKLMVDMFDLVLPEKVAEEVVRKDVKLIYDPATDELVQIVMPFMTRSEVMTLTVDKGWVTEASVEDVKLLPGVRRTMFRLQGGEWVAREVVKDVQSGRAEFVLNTGDMVWWGKQGARPPRTRTGSWWTRTCSSSCPPRTTRCAPPGCRARCSPPSAIMRCGTTPTSKAC